MTELLRAQALRFAWPGAAPLLDGVSLRLGPGLTWLTGDEGCGKTSLLALLAGALRPQAGRLWAAGHWLDEEPAAYRRQVFWIDPATEAHDALPVQAFLDTQATLWPGFDGRTLKRLVGAFGLEPHLHKPLYMLSTGSKRKAWLSAALAAQAPITLIDQPFAALDAPSQRCLGECLDEAASHPRRGWLVADHEAPDWGGPQRLALFPSAAAGF